MKRASTTIKRGYSREDAATYFGVSPRKFDELVQTGKAPKPIRIGSRLIWDVRLLELAFDELAAHDGADANPWD